jgi:hypothetical protein
MQANDNFDQIHRSNDIINAGEWTHLAPYRAGYDVKNAAVIDVPTLFHYGALSSIISGLPSYATLYFYAVFLVLTTFLCAYMIIRKFNTQAALYSLPIVLVFFMGMQAQVVTWGKWTYLTGAAGLIVYSWLLLYADKKYIPVFAGLVLGITYTTHVVEALFGALLTIILYLAECVFEGYTMKQAMKAIHKYLVIASVFLVTSIYYAIEISVVRAGSYSHTFRSIENFTAFHALQFFDYHWFIWVAVLVGVLASIVLLAGKQHYKYITIFGTLGFIFTLMNEVNFGGQFPFYMRLSWPVYLAFFFGLGLYSIARFFPARKTVVFEASGFAIVATIMVMIVSASTVPWGAGIMPQHKWDGMTWMAEQSEPESTVFFFYTDGYQQFTPYRMSERMHYVFNDLQEYLGQAQQGVIRRNITTFRPDSDYQVRTGLFTSVLHPKVPPTNDLCQYDYYFIDRTPSRSLPGIERYQGALALALVNQGNFSIAYDQGGVIILKNDNKESCMANEVRI